MKHLFLIFLIIFSFNATAKDDGLRLIETRAKLRCGTDLSIKAFANKDEDKVWQGFYADLCKVFATAILGKSEAIEMINIKPEQTSQALSKNKIDIMIGAKSNTASEEISSLSAPSGLLYYDNQMFLGYKKENATSMQDYKGANICVVMDSLNLFNAELYSEKYNLDFRFLKFRTEQAAKEAFLLKRCQLLTGSEIALKALETDTIKILPEPIGAMPIHIFVLKENQSLRIAIKWILNALILAEKQGITQQNASVYIGAKDPSTQNLLGDNPSVWKKLGLQPNWVKKAIAEFGNYGEIFSKNLEPLGIERNKNNLIENGGLIQSDVFL